MEMIGEIKPAVAGQLSKEEWIDLVPTQPTLSKPPAREAINPFTKEPFTFSPPPTSAQIMMDGTNIGSIYWAEDDSESLIVESLSEHKTTVSEIASRLNCHFV